MRHYGLGLIGFGGVNRALVEIVGRADAAFWQNLGFSLSIVSVCDVMLGSVQDPAGIDPALLLSTRPQTGGFVTLPGGATHVDSVASIEGSCADIIVEATPTDARSGEPAISHCRAALTAGKHVVTVNKGVVVHGGEMLSTLAAERGLGFEFEGSVMSGTPVIRLGTELLKGAGFRGFEGILNGTSNFVLGRMTDGASFADAVAEAQALGYAEADPTADVGGYDVRLKVVILANRLLGADLLPDAVTCRGIEQLTGDDVRRAVAEGRCWKLIGRASRGLDGNVVAEVAPVALPATHALATIHGATNAILLDTEMLGEVTISGPGAGRIETAYALLSDISAIDRTSTREQA